MAEAAAYPVQQLREHATALEAAMAVCLAGAGEKPVHKLRSQTRRFEAQIMLLRQVHGVPTHTKERSEVLRELKKVRRAAGNVRDRDVHIGMLKEFTKADSDPADPDAAPAAGLRKDAEDLIAAQKQRRERAARRLEKLLKKHEADVAAALEALLHVLKPAEDFAVSASDLLTILEKAASKAYGPNPPCLGHAAKAAAAATAGATASKSKPAEKPKRAPALTDDQLHQLRKRAKLARYLAESAGGSKRARQLARQSEALQDAGGAWHDLLDLAEEAREELGRRHALTVELKTRCKQHRLAFLAALGRTA
jgi:CHAD domain-containing protein